MYKYSVFFLLALLSGQVTLPIDPVTKVIIPAAGLGTRFLPYAKSVPKEMVTVIDKPAIQIVVEEGLAAGANTFVIVTSPTKNTIEDYFTPVTEYTKQLAQKNKSHLIASTQDIINRARFIYPIQEKQLGLGHAVLQVKDSIKNEFFAVILPDDLIFGEEPELKHLMAISQKYTAVVIGVSEVPESEVSSYGIVDVGTEVEPGVYEIKHLVEKPRPENAPSRLAIGGRYVLSDAIFPSLESITPSANGELQLTDAIEHMLKTNPDVKVLAYTFKGKRFDIGVPGGLIKAIIYQALHSPVYGEQTKTFIEEMLSQLKDSSKALKDEL